MQADYPPRAVALVENELKSIAEQACDLLYRETSGYARVPKGELLADVREAVLVAYAAISEERPANEAELAVLARIGAARARAGVPFHALVRGIRVIASLALEVDERQALELGVTLIDPARLWIWAVEAIEAAASAHRQVELEIMREDRYRRAAFLTDLFGGRLSGAKLTALAAEFGLDPGEHYLAFRARIPKADTRRRFEAAAEGAGMAESHQGELVGLLAHSPRVFGDGLVATGQRLPLASAAASFAQATTVLRVAAAYGMTGVVKIADIPLRAAVLESPNLTRLVTEQCLGAIPLAQRRLFTQTLAAYLAHDLHISEAAVELHVHPNTLRYRIRRFEELSGLRLERIDDLVAVWWALQYERITDSDGPAAAP